MSNKKKKAYDLAIFSKILQTSGQSLPVQSYISEKMSEPANINQQVRGLFDNLYGLYVSENMLCN